MRSRVGDAHVVVDPLVGQGANSASFAAWALGEAILEGGPFDDAFCRRVDERRLPFVMAVYDWTNFMTAPEPHLFELVGAMSQIPALADDFTENFNHPDRQWEHLASPGGDRGLHCRIRSPRARVGSPATSRRAVREPRAGGRRPRARRSR